MHFNFLLANVDYVDVRETFELNFRSSRMCVNVTILHNRRISQIISQRLNVIAEYSEVSLSLSGMNGPSSKLVHILNVDRGTFNNIYKINSIIFPFILGGWRGELGEYSMICLCSFILAMYAKDIPIDYLL